MLSNSLLWTLQPSQFESNELTRCDCMNGYEHTHARMQWENDLKQRAKKRAIFEDADGIGAQLRVDRESGGRK